MNTDKLQLDVKAECDSWSFARSGTMKVLHDVEDDVFSVAV